MDPTKELTAIQRIQLELMRIGTFNDFDGDAVATSLVKNLDLWNAAVFTRLGDLIMLRDLHTGMYNADTLYVLVEPGAEDRLWSLAVTWNADELDWLPEDKASDLLGCGVRDPRTLLRAWWD